MKPFCEIMVSKIFPTVRALVAKELMENLNHTQKETADRMGITQPAISQYKRELRGAKAAILEGNTVVYSLIKAQARELSKATAEERVSMLCLICKEIRNQGLLCKMHREATPALNTCTVCLSASFCK